MVELTLFEIHLDGAEFTANAPSIDTGSDGEDAAGVDVDFDEEDLEFDGPSPGKLILVSVVFALLVTLVVRKFLGGDEPDEEEEA